MGGQLTFYCIGLVGVLWAVSSSVAGPCGLEMAPANGLVQTQPRHDVSFVCMARCFGRLSRGALRWRDNNGNVVPGFGNHRIHAVGYNQWTMNRLVIRSAFPSDSGLYTCELLHRGKVIPFMTSLQVENYPEPDRNNGPRRGDIAVEPDPEFGEIRPVREASGDPDRRYRTRQGRPRPPAPPQAQELLARIRRDAVTHFAGMTVGGDVTQDDIFPGTMTPSGVTTENQTSVQPQGVIITAPPPPPPYLPTKASPPDSTTSTKPPSTPKGLTTTAESSESPDSKTSSGQGKSWTTSPAEDEDKGAKNNNTLSASTPGFISGSQDSTYPPASSSSTDSDKDSDEVSDKVTTDGSKTGGSRSGSSQEGDSNPDHPLTGASEGESGESDFGRYGLLAFCLALAVILLLLVAILLFFLLPRCCGHSGMAVFGRGAGDKPKAKDSEAVLLGERPHKPLAPMTSATGLNGEFITPVDLDGKEEGEEEKKEGEAGGSTPNGLQEAQKAETDPTDKPKESYVSTFLIGRLSSSKAEDAPVVAGSSAALEDSVFTPATSTPDIGDGKKKEKEKKEKKDDGSSSSSDEDEDSKPSSSDHSKDPAGLDPGKVTTEPTSVDAGAGDGGGGLMAEIHLQIDPMTGISIEDTPHTEV